VTKADLAGIWASPTVIGFKDNPKMCEGWEKWGALPSNTWDWNGRIIYGHDMIDLIQFTTDPVFHIEFKMVDSRGFQFRYVAKWAIGFPTEIPVTPGDLPYEGMTKNNLKIKYNLEVIQDTGGAGRVALSFAYPSGGSGWYLEEGEHEVNASDVMAGTDVPITGCFMSLGNRVENGDIFEMKMHYICLSEK